MAFLLVPVLLALPIVIGPSLGGFLYWDSHHAPAHGKKRGPHTAHAIVQFNGTELRGKDVHKLQGLQVDLINADTALVSGKDFSVRGNVTLHPHSEVGKPYVNGELSFKIPGLDVAIDGSFVVVNETAADNKTRDDFEKVYASLQVDVFEPKDILDAIAKIAQTL